MQWLSGYLDLFLDYIQVGKCIRLGMIGFVQRTELVPLHHVEHQGPGLGVQRDLLGNPFWVRLRGDQQLCKRCWIRLEGDDKPAESDLPKAEAILAVVSSDSEHAVDPKLGE